MNIKQAVITSYVPTMRLNMNVKMRKINDIITTYR